MVILAIGLLAMAIVQANTLRTNRRAEVTKEARVLAEAEVDRRRSVTLTTGTAQNCLVTLTSSYSCTVDVEDCEVNAGAFNCAPSGIGSPVMKLVTVAVTGPLNTTFTIETLVRD